jgi:hypothetical protein
VPLLKATGTALHSTAQRLRELPCRHTSCIALPAPRRCFLHVMCDERASGTPADCVLYVGHCLHICPAAGDTHVHSQPPACQAHEHRR